MHKWLFPVALLLFSTARAQYYYNDILSNRIARENFLLLKKAGIKNVTVSSSDPSGEPTEGFSVKQEVNTRNNTIETLTQSAYSNPSILTSIFSADGWPVASSDSTAGSVSRTSYTYGSDASHPLQTVSSTTGFPGEKINQFVEVRNYTTNGTRPLSLLRIKNGKDTLRVNFIAEEHGWVGEERWIQKGKTIETYYYYYDAAGRVTDITHFNKTARRILPDYAFEYDAQGRITSTITFINGTNQYRTWRYTYDNRGLKTGEVVFNKYRQPEGKLVYSYQ